MRTIVIDFFRYIFDQKIAVPRSLSGVRNHAGLSRLSTSPLLLLRVLSTERWGMWGESENPTSPSLGVRDKEFDSSPQYEFTV